MPDNRPWSPSPSPSTPVCPRCGRPLAGALKWTDGIVLLSQGLCPTSLSLTLIQHRCLPQYMKGCEYETKPN